MITEIDKNSNYMLLQHYRGNTSGRDRMGGTINARDGSPAAEMIMLIPPVVFGRPYLFE
jgi:hypothetical protein